VSAHVTGVDAAVRVYDKVDKRLVKERQKIFRTAAGKTLVKTMRADAKRSPGRAGPRLAAATTARFGKKGAVLVGPRTGKRTSRRGAWFRAIYIAGSPAHKVGAERAGGLREYRSSSKQYAATGGLFYRRIKARPRKFLYNPAGPFLAMGPVTVRAIAANPFVTTGEAQGHAAFVQAVTAALYPEAKQ